MSSTSDPGAAAYPPTVVQSASPQSDVTTAHQPKSSQSSGFEGNLAQLMALLASSQLPGGPVVVEGYKLLTAVGRGGFGCVWEAQDLSTGETVAIKFLVRHNRDTGCILEEVKHLASVQGCFGVIPVKAVREHGVPPHFVPHYVMQYAPGGSFQKLIDDGGKLKASEVVKRILPVVKALAFIHKRQVVHSDLKPANLLINEAGEPLIADFGQAQRNSQSSGQGTFFYMAPERATIEKLRPDPRWDVYAIGAILHAMLTGHPPRQDERLKEELKSLPYDERLRTYREGLAKLPPPAEHREHCDRDLGRIINRCLAIDPAKRPNDAGEVLNLLNRRSYLRHMKPLIRLGIAATLLLPALLAALLFWGRDHLDDQQRSIEAGVKAALMQKAHIGSQFIEDTLSENVCFVEYHANQRCPYEIRLLLEKISNQIAENVRNKRKPLEGVSGHDHKVLDTWLQKDIYSVLARRNPHNRKSLALHVTVKDGLQDKFFSYLVARIEGHGRESDPVDIDPKADRDELNPTIYTRNWAWRDYFNGQQTYYDRVDEARPVVTQTHISHQYRSQARNLDAAPKRYSWKTDVSTPIWNEPLAPEQIQRGFQAADFQNRKVVAVLVCGLFESDLDLGFRTPAGEPDAAAAKVPKPEIVIVNDRKSWIMHEGVDPKRLLNPDTQRQSRDPDNYEVLERDADPALLASHKTACEILFTDPGSHANYVDLVKSTKTPTREIVAWSPCKPYRDSCYTATRAKSWSVLAQVNYAESMGRVDEIRRNMRLAVLAVFAILLAVVVFLWVWLIRLVQRAEFAGNG